MVIGAMKLRNEQKFLLDYGTYLQIRSILQKIMKMDENTLNGEGYHIRSMYFDDMYETALKEKASGIQMRKKYRIRIYNYSQRVIKLEIKEKYGDYTNKLACNITKDEYKKIVNSDISFLVHGNGNKRNESNKDSQYRNSYNRNNVNSHNDQMVKNQYYLQMKNNLLKPKVIVDYHREAYVLPYNDIRITFDKNLAAAKPCQNIFTDKVYSKRLEEEYSMIMEVKYNNFLPNHIKKVLEIYPLTRLSVSKYLLCRQELLNWGRDIL